MKDRHFERGTGQPIDQTNEVVAALHQKFVDIRRRRRIHRILRERQIAVIAEARDAASAPETLAKRLNLWSEEEQDLAREYMLAYRSLESEVSHACMIGSSRYAAQLSLLTASGSSLASPFPNCLRVDTFDSPPFLVFGGVRYLDSDPRLFVEIVAPAVGELPAAPPGAGPNSTGLIGTPNVSVTAWGGGKTAWISASWCFKPPTDVELCGFVLAGSVDLDGLVENKSGSSVTIKMDAGITQYRSVDKPWNEINPSVDEPYRNIRALCHRGGGGGASYPAGYTDGQYGLHSLEPLTASIETPFSKGCSWYDYLQDDVFFVGYWVEINVGDESFIQFEHNGRGTIVMRRPTLTYYCPVA